MLIECRLIDYIDHSSYWHRNCVEGEIEVSHQQVGTLYFCHTFDAWRSYVGATLAERFDRTCRGKVGILGPPLEAALVALDDRPSSSLRRLLPRWAAVRRDGSVPGRVSGQFARMGPTPRPTPSWVGRR